MTKKTKTNIESSKREINLNSFVGKTLIEIDWSMSTETEKVLNMLFEDGTLLQIRYPFPTELVYAIGHIDEEDEEKFKEYILPILKASVIKLTAEIDFFELKKGLYTTRN